MSLVSGGAALSATKEIQDRRGSSEAEVFLSQRKNVVEACRQIGVSDQTYYRWRKECGGIHTDQTKRLKELDRKNAGEFTTTQSGYKSPTPEAVMTNQTAT